MEETVLSRKNMLLGSASLLLAGCAGSAAPGFAPGASSASSLFDNMRKVGIAYFVEDGRITYLPEFEATLQKVGVLNGPGKSRSDCETIDAKKAQTLRPQYCNYNPTPPYATEVTISFAGFGGLNLYTGSGLWGISGSYYGGNDQPPTTGAYYGGSNPPKNCGPAAATAILSGMQTIANAIQSAPLGTYSAALVAAAGDLIAQTVTLLEFITALIALAPVAELVGLLLLVGLTVVAVWAYVECTKGS